MRSVSVYDEANVFELPVNMLEVKLANSSRSSPENRVREICVSILKEGQKEPVVVVAINGGGFGLFAGYLRYEAIKRANTVSPVPIPIRCILRHHFTTQMAVDVTPPAFSKANPDAAKNIAAADAASKRLQDVLIAKARFLDSLMTEGFQSVDNLVRGLIHIQERRHEGSVQGRLDMAEIGKEYEALQKEHNAAGQALHDAFCPKV